MKEFLDKLLSMAKPRVKPPSPYADVMERALAAGIDIWWIFMLLGRMFEQLGQRIYRGADLALIEQAQQSESFLQAVSLLWQSGLLSLWLINAGAQLLILGVLIVSMQVWWQATPGKWLLGLKIVRRHSFEPLEPWRYAVRYVGYIVAATPLMIGILWSHFNTERRGWHDMMAGSVVIQTRPRGWYWQQCKRGFRWLKARLLPTRNTPQEPQEK